MTKKRITFSIFNYFDETSKEVVKLQTAFKGVSLLITGSTYFASSEKNTMIALVACAVINELFGFIKVYK